MCFFSNSFAPMVQGGTWPQHVHDDLLKHTPHAPSSDVSKAILFVPLTPGPADGDPSPCWPTTGCRKHSFTQVAVWRGKKGPSDHLPPVSATMGSVLPECAEGRLAFVPIRPGGGAAKALCPV